MSGGDGNADEWSRLAAESARLPDGKFLKIYELLEQMRERPEVQGAFETIRPRLTELRPPRRLAVSRLFFRPVEDVLDDPMGYQRRLNRISRAVLAPCWRALRDRLPHGLVAEMQSTLSTIDSRDARALAVVGEPLWTAGAAALDQLLVEVRANLKLQVTLFGRDEDVLNQLATVADVVRIGPRIEALKLALPAKPIGELAESHVEIVKTAMIELGRENPRHTGPALLVLTSRMRRPGDLLRMLQEVRLGGTPQEKEGLTRELSGIVVGNLLRQTSDMDREAASADSSELAATAERLTEGLNSVNEAVLALRDKEMSRKVDGARTEIGEFVKRTIISDVDQALLGTLFGPDAAVDPDEKVRKAEQLALALRKSARLAPHLGIKREVDAKINEIRRQVEAGTETVLRGQPGAEVQRRMFNSLRVIEILAGSDEAERLFREWQRRSV